MSGRRLLSAAALERVRRRAHRPPRIALMGEFSAGKSTLLNLLAGAAIAPSQVTATPLPALWLRRGDGGVRAELVHRDGSVRRCEPGLLVAPEVPDCLVGRLTDPDLDLPGFELIDTPGLSNPTRERAELPLLCRRVDAVVWCTPATQAWRQSELDAWSALPARLRSRSLLLATRADLLAPGDLAKVLKRLERETAGLFGAVQSIATPVAAAARQARDGAGWEASGGGALERWLEAATARHVAAMRERLERYAEADPPRRPAPRAVSVPESPADRSEASVFIDNNTDLSDLLVRVRQIVNTRTEKNGDVTDQTKVPLELISREDGGVYDARRIVRQLERELEGLGDGGWIEVP